MKTFKTVEGVYVPNLSEVHECYCLKEIDGSYRFTINVSAENIDQLFRKLTTCVPEPCFLLFECGTNKVEEQQLRKSDSDPFHVDVFYIDGLDKQNLFQVYDKFNNLLINDGEINYGIGSHKETEEIFIGSYKIFTIFTRAPSKYEAILNEFGYQKQFDIKTVWDTFTREQPGERKCIKTQGVDIYEMVEQLKGKGLYLAQRREC